MSDHVYKHIEITGTSEDSIEDAVDGALKKASETVRNMRWFEVTGLRGSVSGDHSDHWQVTIKVGFTLED